MHAWRQHEGQDRDRHRPHLGHRQANRHRAVPDGRQGSARLSRPRARGGRPCGDRRAWRLGQARGDESRQPPAPRRSASSPRASSRARAARRAGQQRGHPPARSPTEPRGIELVFATNVLGYHGSRTSCWTCCVPALQPASSTSPPRLPGNLDLDDLELERRGYDAIKAYSSRRRATGCSPGRSPDGSRVVASRPTPWRRGSCRPACTAIRPCPCG